MESVERIRFHVSGRVQGVGFRAFAVRAAAEAGVSGWVRNTWDGRVEGEAEGTTTALARFFTDLRSGPPMGFVQSLTTDPLAALGETSAFRIRRDG